MAQHISQLAAVADGNRHGVAEANRHYTHNVVGVVEKQHAGCGCGNNAVADLSRLNHQRCREKNEQD